MNYGNQTTGEFRNEITPFDYTYNNDQSFHEVSQKESGCFSDYFVQLADDDTNELKIEGLNLNDDINESNICYWKNKRKTPKFLHDHYLLGDTIGRGSYGKVKDCIDIRTLKRYAMKIVCRMKIKKIPGGMRHVENEISLMKLLFHENIVRLIDDFRELDPERRCIVMEFCVGSIHDLQSNGILESSNLFRCLPEWQTHMYFVQVIAGIEYLHSQRIIHKDLKPGNFLLTEHETVKITDFGVSEKFEIFQPNSFISGGQTTPAIQPPELAVGASNICGYKLDVYGAGVSLYFMLCGRVPFNNPNILLIFDEIASGEYTIPDRLSSSVSDLIRMMMYKDVNMRFDICNVKQHDWFIDPGERIGEKIDPKIYLKYGARDPSKENLYRLFTDESDELPAIMPLSITSRLRTYYNWPLTIEEQRALIDEQLIIADDFIRMDVGSYEQLPETAFQDEMVDNETTSRGQVGIRFFIQPDDKNDSHRQNPSSFRHNDDLEIGDGTNCSMSVSLSHSVLENKESFEHDSISRKTFPIDSSTCKTKTKSAQLSNESKSSKSKSKWKNRRLARCTQS